MKAFTCILALVALLPVSFAAPEPVTENTLVARGCACSASGVPLPIVALADALVKIEADITAKISLDLTAKVVAEIVADLNLIDGEVKKCTKGMTGYNPKGVNIGATATVLASIFLKLDAILALCLKLSLSVSLKAAITACIALIKVDLKALLSICANLFVGIKLLISVKVGVLAVLGSII